MPGIRAVMVTMPVVVSDLLRRMARDRAALDVVAELSDRRGLLKQIRRLRPELVVIGLASGESAALVEELLLTAPAALVIAFAEDGRRAVGYELRLHSTDLAGASPESLTEFILTAVASRLGPPGR